MEQMSIKNGQNCTRRRELLPLSNESSEAPLGCGRSTTRMQQLIAMEGSKRERPQVGPGGDLKGEMRVGTF